MLDHARYPAVARRAPRLRAGRRDRQPDRGRSAAEHHPAGGQPQAAGAGGGAGRRPGPPRRQCAAPDRGRGALRRRDRGGLRPHPQRHRGPGGAVGGTAPGPRLYDLGAALADPAPVPLQRPPCRAAGRGGDLHRGGGFRARPGRCGDPDGAGRDAAGARGDAAAGGPGRALRGPGGGRAAPEPGRSHPARQPRPAGGLDNLVRRARRGHAGRGALGLREHHAGDPGRGGRPWRGDLLAGLSSRRNCAVGNWCGWPRRPCRPAITTGCCCRRPRPGRRHSRFNPGCWRRSQRKARLLACRGAPSPDKATLWKGRLAMDLLSSAS